MIHDNIFELRWRTPIIDTGIFPKKTRKWYHHYFFNIDQVLMLDDDFNGEQLPIDLAELKHLRKIEVINRRIEIHPTYDKATAGLGDQSVQKLAAKQEP